MASRSHESKSARWAALGVVLCLCVLPAAYAQVDLNSLIGLLPDQLEAALQQLQQQAQQEIDDALNNLDSAFNNYKSKYNRTYRDAAEEAQRKLNFAANAAKTKALSLLPNRTSFVQLGPFADLTKQEFISSWLGLNTTGLTVDNNKIDTASVGRASSAPPASVNWVTANRVVPIKNQGQCGNCWVFSTTSAIETASAVLSGELYSLSEQQTTDCGASQAVNGNACNGGQIQWTADYTMSNGGLTAESAYPYIGGPSGSCNQQAANWKVVQIQDYRWVAQKSASAMMASVAKGSVAVGISGSSDEFQFYGGGLFSGFNDCCNTADCQGNIDHAVVVVGYDQQQGYWLLRNSWGTSWGEGGYMRASMATPTGFPSGICGMLSYGLRPVKNEPNTISGTPPPGATLVNLAAGSSPGSSDGGNAASLPQLSLGMLAMAVMGALVLLAL